MGDDDGPVDVDECFARDDFEGIHRALLSLTFHHPDWRYVQDLCLKYLQHTDPYVRRIAVICLGHLATFHGQLDEDKVRAALADLKDDKAMAGAVDDALDDLDQGLRKRG